MSFLFSNFNNKDIMENVVVFFVEIEKATGSLSTSQWNLAHSKHFLTKYLYHHC